MGWREGTEEPAAGNARAPRCPEGVSAGTVCSRPVLARSVADPMDACGLLFLQHRHAGRSAGSRYPGFQRAESQVSAGPRFCLGSREGPRPEATRTHPQARCRLRGFTGPCALSSVNGNGSHEGRQASPPKNRRHRSEGSWRPAGERVPTTLRSAWARRGLGSRALHCRVGRGWVPGDQAAGPGFRLRALERALAG